MILRRELSRRRQHPAEGLADHRQRALSQIAEIVGEIGIDAVDDRLMRIIAVLSEWHLTQEEITHLVDAVVIGERRRVDHIADRLRHFLPAIEQEAMHHDLLRDRQASRHEEGGPEDRVEAGDVLADHVGVGGPEGRALRALIGKAGRGDVVGEGVDPHIHHMLVIARHGHAPVEGGAADRQIRDPALH